MSTTTTPAEAPEPVEQHPSGLRVQTADLTLSKPPEWAWQDRIVLGSLNLILGAEGAGKGTLAAWMLARLTRGTLPGALAGEPVNVAVIGDEDGFADVWTPRLHATRADLTRIRHIERPDGGLVELRADRTRLAQAIDLEHVKVLYLDALIDNLGAAVDDWRGKAVRDALAPARAIAREYNVAVIGSMHPNKSGASFRQLVSGSIAFNAVSRSSLLLAEHPEDPDRRVLVRGKGNLSQAPDAVEFDVISHQFDANGHTFNVPRATHFTTSDLTAADLIAPPTTPPPAGEARTNARDLINDLLADGDWHPAGTIIDACHSAGVYRRAAQRAARDLGITQEKRGYPARVFWQLPTARSNREDTEATPAQTVIPVTSVASADLALIGRGDRQDRDDSENECHLSVTSDDGWTDDALQALVDSDPDADTGAGT